MMQKKNRAFLKWAGGKYSLVEHIQARLPQANKLIEPFVGAGSVFLNTQFSRYLLNDINPDLINLYNLLKAQPDALINDISTFFSPRYNEEAMYYSLREEFNATQDEYYRAILFVYLNRHGYNGLCRYSLAGKFNVPFGRYKKPYFPEHEMFFFAEKSQRPRLPAYLSKKYLAVPAKAMLFISTLLMRLLAKLPLLPAMLHEVLGSHRKKN